MFMKAIKMREQNMLYVMAVANSNAECRKLLALFRNHENGIDMHNIPYRRYYKREM